MACRHEKSIETRSVRTAERYGFRSIKIGDNGMPDRLFFRNGWHFWVEFKRPGGRLSSLQHAVIDDLRRVGETVLVVDNANQLIEFLEGLK